MGEKYGQYFIQLEKNHNSIYFIHSFIHSKGLEIDSDGTDQIVYDKNSFKDKKWGSGDFHSYAVFWRHWWGCKMLRSDKAGQWMMLVILSLTFFVFFFFLFWLNCVKSEVVQLPSFQFSRLSSQHFIMLFSNFLYFFIILLSMFHLITLPPFLSPSLPVTCTGLEYFFKLNYVSWSF